MITFTKQATAHGSNMTQWNVDRDGNPFGQIWTFRAPGEVHPYHVKPLDGVHETFRTIDQAKRYMEKAGA